MELIIPASNGRVLSRLGHQRVHTGCVPEAAFCVYKVTESTDYRCKSMMSSFQQECLASHNKMRKKHGASKLTLNRELCSLAEKWAQHLLSLGELKHSNNKHQGKQLGENVACKRNSGGVEITYTGAEVSEQWYAEVKEYDFGKNEDPKMKSGHFSQVVWKDSKEFGVGMAAKAGQCIVVANYYPAGNYIGQYKDNVAPLSTGAKIKGLFAGNKKSGTDSDSSSSDDEASRPRAAGTSAIPTTTSRGTRKVTTTRTIKKPDGTVETITEERIEEIPISELDRNFNQVDINPKKTSAGSAGRPSSAGSQSSKEFQDEALKTHNKCRSKHGASSLTLNKDLCKAAQKWADHLASISTLQHSNNTDKGEPLGENVASKWGSNGADYTGKAVVEQWYSEEPTYDYSGKSNAGSAGHFSQVVWKGSKELGIGKAKDGKGRVYVVANYKPAGNYLGHFAENVSRPR